MKFCDLNYAEQQTHWLDRFMKKSSNHDQPFLMDVTLLREKVSSWNEYPFNLPVVKNLETLSLHRNVTFIIGENGTGKSTLARSHSDGHGLQPGGWISKLSFLYSRFAL